MAVIKREYELSVWDEQLNSDGTKQEKKGAIIGAHDMTYLGRATNIKLRREIKGTNTLTFDMVQKFFDPEQGKYVKNELIDYLYNEKKLKLNFDGQWFEFYIKSINEKKEFKSITKSFTCQDSFIDELSRTGYEIMFDEELYNNVDEVSPFMETILEDSIWDYRADLNIGDFTEFTEERFYKIPLEQFGGEIVAHPINLQVETSDLNINSTYYKEKAKDGFILNEKSRKEETTLKNIYTEEERQLELGDDLSYQKEIFWDPFHKDNGHALISKDKIVLKGKYIYVAYSDLKFIYGSIFEDAYKSTEEPALYGIYGSKEKKGYALQPASKDPSALIQFIFFNEEDEVLIDEAGTVANNDCHYVIAVEEWNKILESIYQEKVKDLDAKADKGVIHWSTEFIEGVDKTTKYDIVEGDIYYTKNVLPDSSTIDDFTWFPVYYEDYLSEINDKEVFAARKISVTDRTEFNLNAEYYTTIYNNRAIDYNGLYSEKEEPEFLDAKDFRVQSMEETRIIVPTLARNLITNGEQITTDDGWEALTQSNQNEYNTGSYANLLEINVKTTTQDLPDYENTGETIDEGISDFYLEFLSPNIEKCDNFDAEGEVSSDYALNFGLTELENGIEKDKIYAIRICTGEWNIVDYDIIFRKDFNEDSNDNEEDNENKDEEVKDEAILVQKGLNQQQVDNYEIALKNYNNLLLKNDIIYNGNKLTVDSSKEDFQNLIKQWVAEADEKTDDIYSKLSNVTHSNDWKYLVNRLYNDILKEIQKKEESLTWEEELTEEEKELKKTAQEKLKGDYSETLEEDTYLIWKDSLIYTNRVFNKNYNTALDKIIIGQGSIDINGNYHLEGAQNEDSDKFISFADIFERITESEEDIYFAGYNIKDNKEDTQLIKTLYHQKEGKKWIWTESKNEEVNQIEDNAFLLFKAKANISSPYLGVLTESEPMKVETNTLTVKTYSETDLSGIKIEIVAENQEDKRDYYVDGAEVRIYTAEEKNFSSDFLSRIGISNEESNKPADDEDKDNTEDAGSGEQESENKETDNTVKVVSENKEDNKEDNNEDNKEEEEIKEGEYSLKDGDLVPTATPLLSSKSSSIIPLFFRAIVENADSTNKYVLFINDLYYGVFWLEKKITDNEEDEDKKDEDNKDEDNKEDNSEKEQEENGGETK